MRRNGSKPLALLAQPSTMECPVCNFALSFEPWTEDGASHEICPSCGIHFGYNDARADLRAFVYEGWRAAWIANDRQALTGAQWDRVAREVIEAATRRQ